MGSNQKDQEYIYDLEKRENFSSRLKGIAGCDSLLELSAFFGVRQAIVSDWLRRSFIPSFYQGYVRSQGINPEWVNTGEGEKTLPHTSISSQIA